MLSNPGKAFSMYNVAERSGKAYLKAMTPSNITSVFWQQVFGIHPFNSEVFEADDLM